MAIIELPGLSEIQQQICSDLSAGLAEQIARQGPMSFAEYMHRCLYEPGLGYYVNGLSKIGPSGDFITAPELSSDLAACVAAQTAEVLSLIGHGDVLEFGGGSGRLAVDVLRALDERQCLPHRYLLLDVSADLKQLQKELVNTELPPELASRVEWVDNFVDDFHGVAIANELFDAFPVERFSVNHGDVQQICVDYDERGFRLSEVENREITAHVQRLLAASKSDLPPDYHSEFCPVMAPWWASLSESFNTGLLIALDYGCERSRYYSPLRSSGSTRCFFQHTQHSDPLIYQGVQDITADVDFTAVAEAAVASQFALEGYTSMTQFMLSLGVIDHHKVQTDGMAEKERIAATGRLKQVLMPEEMGERFMVAGFSRNIDPVLRGFSAGDQSRLL